MKGRALHYVFKIGDRQKNAMFFRDILGMKVLRHEEFKEGCAAACNGPYNNRWSKTMIGYGPEDNHFVLELTWNTEVSRYEKGNDFLGITIKSQESIARAKALQWPIESVGDTHVLESPDGYLFYILDEPEPTDRDPVLKLSLASTSIDRTVSYWNQILGIKILHKDDQKTLFTYDENQAFIEFKKIDEPINHATAYGRVAFAVPMVELKDIESNCSDNKCKILTPMITLDTPGKASVTVVILADPDGHEICFVDDENFRLLSKVDPEADSMLNFQMAKYQKFLEKEKEKTEAKQ